MGIPVIEFVYAPASELLRQDLYNKDASVTAISLLKAQDGFIKMYNGIQHEDKATAYIIIAWESYEHHEKLVKDAEVHPKLERSSSSVFDLTKGPRTMLHINCTSEPYKALEAPVTELVICTLHDGQSMSELQGYIENLVKHYTIKVESNKEGERVFEVSWGLARENKNIMVIFMGWSSVKAHLDMVMTDPKAFEIIKKCRAIADATTVHSALVLL